MCTYARELSCACTYVRALSCAGYGFHTYTHIHVPCLVYAHMYVHCRVQVNRELQRDVARLETERVALKRRLVDSAMSRGERAVALGIHTGMYTRTRRHRVRCDQSSTECVTFGGLRNEPWRTSRRSWHPHRHVHTYTHT